jgi:hypothetical protein
MKHYPLPLLAALAIACAAGGCSASSTDLLSDRSRWNEDFTRLSPPTPECPGGSVAALETRINVIGPYTLESFKTMEARSKPEAPESGTTTVFLYPVSRLVEERLTASDRIYAFDFSSNPDASPWWAFRGVLVAHGDCIIHVDITGYDHG